MNFRTGKYAKKKCAFCNELTTNAKYCSTNCQHEDVRQALRIKIQSTGKLYSKWGKWYLVETRGHKCELCGITEWQGAPVSLILDHIDGNSDDWSLNNLRLICPNCDAQTPTYKSRNRGKGRAYRRQRYAEGKSY